MQSESLKNFRVWSSHVMPDLISLPRNWYRGIHKLYPTKTIIIAFPEGSSPAFGTTKLIWRSQVLTKLSFVICENMRFLHPPIPVTQKFQSYWDRGGKPRSDYSITPIQWRSWFQFCTKFVPFCVGSRLSIWFYSHHAQHARAGQEDREEKDTQ